MGRRVAAFSGVTIFDVDESELADVMQSVLVRARLSPKDNV